MISLGTDSDPKGVTISLYNSSFKFLYLYIYINIMDLENLRNLEIRDIDFLSEEEEEMQMRAPKRYIRDGQNPFDFHNEWEFKRRFRFSKHSVMFGILPLIEEGLARINNRGLPIPSVLQLLICLRFYATASYQVCNKIIVLIKLAIKYLKNIF